MTVNGEWAMIRKEMTVVN